MNIPSPQEGVPRNRGLGGKPPMSAASGIALIEGDPQRIFGYFLCEQKVTPAPRPAGRNSKIDPFPSENKVKEKTLQKGESHL